MLKYALSPGPRMVIHIHNKGVSLSHICALSEVTRDTTEAQQLNIMVQFDSIRD